MTDDCPLWESTMKRAWLELDQRIDPALWLAILPPIDPNKNDEKELEDEH